MKDGNIVQSAVVSVPKEQSVITIPTVQAAVLRVVKQQSVVSTNSGTLVHLLVVISIVKATMNVEIITMHDHVSNDVRVSTDMFATGTILKVFASNNTSVNQTSAQNILISPIVVLLAQITSVVPINIATCLTASLWVAVLCASATMDM